MVSKLKFLGVAEATWARVAAKVATWAKAVANTATKFTAARAAKKFTTFSATALVAFGLTACGGWDSMTPQQKQYYLGMAIEKEKYECNQGYANACKGLGAYYLNQNNYNGAKYYFGLACNMGDSEACEFYNRVQN